MTLSDRVARYDSADVWRAPMMADEVPMRVIAACGPFLPPTYDPVGHQ